MSSKAIVATKPIRAPIAFLTTLTVSLKNNVIKIYLTYYYSSFDNLFSNISQIFFLHKTADNCLNLLQILPYLWGLMSLYQLQKH